MYFSTIWRTSLGIGTVFPLVLFVLRLKLKEPEEFSKNSMKNVRTPYSLVLRFYGWRLFVVSLIWFIYDVGNRYRTPTPSNARLNIPPSSPPIPSAYTPAQSFQTSTETRHR